MKRQRQDVVTVSNPIARKINTPLLFPIHRACCQSSATSAVVSDHLGFSFIFHWRLCCHCCSISAHLPPPTPPLSSYISWACRLVPATSFVVSNLSDASYIPCHLPTPLLLLLSRWACLTLPTPPPYVFSFDSEVASLELWKSERVKKE